jgi:hypothetical protein
MKALQYRMALLSIVVPLAFTNLSRAIGAEISPMLMGMNASARDGQNVFSVMKDLGVHTLRFDAPWNQVEVVRGQYSVPSWVESTVNSAVTNGMEPLVILAYGNPLYGGDKPRTDAERDAFSRYAAFVVAHFKGRVRYFELWNEWETHTGGTTPGSASDYVSLAKVAYPAIKSANSTAVVVAAGTADLKLAEVDSGYLAAFFKAGGMNYADGVGLHPYNEPKEDPRPEHSIQIVDAVHDLGIRTSLKPVPIYVTEMGYATYGGDRGVTDTAQAAYLARFLLLAASRDYIRGVWWYNLKDVGTQASIEEQHFGIFSPGLEKKVGAFMFESVTNMLGKNSTVTTGVSAGSYTTTVKTPTYSQVITWTDNNSASSSVETFPAQSPAKRLQLIDFAKSRPGTVTDMHITPSNSAH